MNDKRVDLEKEVDISIPEDLLEEEVVTLSFAESCVQIVSNPSNVFEALKQKPRFLLPCLLVVGVLLLSTLLMWDAIQTFTAESIRYQMELQGQSGDLPEGMFKMGSIMAVVGILVGIPMVLAVKGLVVHVFMLLFNGKGTVRQSMAVVANAYMVMVISAVVKVPIVMLTGNYGVTFSPALFLSREAMFSPWYTALANLDVFVLWYLGLSILGVSIVHKTSKMKAALAVLVPYFVMISFGLLGGLISTMMN